MTRMDDVERDLARVAGERTEWMIHIPIDATSSEIDEITDAVAAVVFEKYAEHGAIISTHPGACDQDDHCFGPGSRARRQIEQQALTDYGAEEA